MMHALWLAGRARHTAHPNPAVGAVVVHDGRIVGEGWTRPVGGAHAEVVALRDAGDGAAGATAYVTLEPCRHQGQTPPCTDALIAAGVSRVVVGSRDLNTVASGGAEVLRRAGVDVTVGVLSAWTDAHHRTFLTAARHANRPMLTLKLAQLPTGELSRPGGGWVTGAAARRAVHQRRARADGVLVGSGTVLADDPRLDVRDVPCLGPQPVPIVFDARGRTPVTARVARPGGIVVTASSSPHAWHRGLEAAGVKVLVSAVARDGRLDLVAAMQVLRAAGIHDVFAEPGPILGTAFVRAGLVDVHIQHVALGGSRPQDVHPVPGTEPLHVWPVAEWRRLGDDLEVVRHRPQIADTT